MLTHKKNQIAVKVTKWGNSFGIRIPQNMLKQIGINEHADKVSLELNNNKIIVERQHKNPVREALDGFDYEQYFAKHDGLDLVDYGKPQGHEMF